MLTLRHFVLRAGTRVKPHHHNTHLTCTYLYRGRLRDTLCNNIHQHTIPVDRVFQAPALFFRRLNAVHTQIALARCQGFQASVTLRSPKHARHASGILLALLTLWSAHAQSCTHNTLAPHQLTSGAILPAQQECFFTALVDAAKHNDVTAQVKLGIALLEGIAGERDAIRGLYWLKRAADSGDPLARDIYQAYKDDSGEGYVC